MPGSQTFQVTKVMLNVSQGEHSPVTQSPCKVVSSAVDVRSEEHLASSASIVKETLPMSQLPVSDGLVQPATANGHSGERLASCAPSPRVRSLGDTCPSPVPHGFQGLSGPGEMNAGVSTSQKGTGALEDISKNGAKQRVTVQQRTTGATDRSKIGQRRPWRTDDAPIGTLQPGRQNRLDATSTQIRKSGVNGAARPSALQALRDKRQGIAADAGLAQQGDESNVSMISGSRNMNAQSRMTIPSAPMLDLEGVDKWTSNKKRSSAANDAEAVSAVKLGSRKKVDPYGSHTNVTDGRQSTAQKASHNATKHDPSIAKVTEKAQGLVKRSKDSSKNARADDETNVFDLPLSPGPKKNLKSVPKRRPAPSKVKKSASTREAESDAFVPVKAQSKRRPGKPQAGRKAGRQNVAPLRDSGATLTRTKAKASVRMRDDEKEDLKALGRPSDSGAEHRALEHPHADESTCNPLVNESISQFESQVVDLDGDDVDPEHSTVQQPITVSANCDMIQGHPCAERQNHGGQLKNDEKCVRAEQTVAERLTLDVVQDTTSKAASKSRVTQKNRVLSDHEDTIRGPHFENTANLPSSPPENDQSLLPPQTGDMVNGHSSVKANLISFDHSGPRNQGTLSGKKPRKPIDTQQRKSVLPGNLPYNSEPFRNVGVHSADREHKARSVQSATKSNWDYFKAPPSNVARSMSDALAEFRIGVTGASEHCTSGNSLKASEQAIRQDEDDAFTFIDDVDMTTEFAPDNQISAKKVFPEPRRLTTSQLAMPPPGMLGSKRSLPREEPDIVRGCTSGDALHATSGASRSESQLKRPRETAQQREDGGHKRQKRADDLSSHPVVRISANDSHPNSTQAPGFRTDFASQPLSNRFKPKDRIATRKSSQTVDIQGSPIPAGVKLSAADDRTVLEVLSQSQQLAVTPELIHGTSSPSNATSNDRTPPPSSEEGVLTSIVKPPPPSANEASMSIAGNVLGRIDTARVTKEHRNDPNQDPFRSTDSALRQKPTEFSKRLFLMAQAQADDEPVVASQENDTDRTLVNPHGPTHRLLSSSESDFSSEPRPTAMDDIGKWRDCLRVDQINLFDELVSISHKLVQHLVSSEDARSDAVNDYQKRGAHIIQTMQATHIAQYRKHVTHLAKVKKKVGRNLAACNDRLRGFIGDLAEMKQRSDEQRDPDHDVQRALQNVMSTFC
nr:hypothetical protein CFP56_56881 [Quercus suber]